MYRMERCNRFDLNEPSNYTATVSDFVSGHYTAPTASFSQSRPFYGASRTVSDLVSSVTNTGLIPLEIHPRSSFQMQNLWNASTTPFTPSTHFDGDSSLALLENSTQVSFIEQRTNFHGGSSSASRNQSNVFIQPSSSSRYQSNVAIHPSSGPMGYLPGRDANFLRNNIDPTLLPLVIGESTVAVYNRERIQSVGGSAREPGHRDNPIVIEDDEEDDNDYAQHNGIFYEGDMSYEALLSLQEHIGGVGTGLKKNVISQLLKQSKYQSTKMKNCSDSCCICLGTYDDNEELGKIDCGHKFHYQCIRKWLKINNSCPICRRIALNP